MPSPAATAVHLVLTTELIPGIRAAVTQLGGDAPDSLVHTRPTPTDAPYPTNSAAALVRHLCGVFTSWGAGCLGGEDVSRDRDAEFTYDGPVMPLLEALEQLADLVPAWAAAAKERGVLERPAGSVYPVDRARSAGTFTVEWVLAHLVHEVAAHLGHLQVTRDILLSFDPR